MVVRCGGCEQLVSEWAARCPHCGRALDEAELIPDPNVATDAPPPVTVSPPEVVTEPPPASLPSYPLADLPAGPRPPAGPPLPAGRPSSTRAVVLAVAGVAIAGLIVGAILLNQPGAPAPTPSSGRASSAQPSITAAPVPSGPARSRLRAAQAPVPYPADLVAERLFFAEPTQTGLYQADGTVVTDFARTPGAGEQPLVSGDGVVVYLHGLDAYRTSGESGAHLVDLGAASWIFPAEHGAIGIQSGQAGQPTFVQYMTADGAMPAPGSTKVRLPARVTAVAQVPSGILVTSGAPPATYPAPVNHLRLSLIEAHTRVSLGPAAAVLGTHGAMAAWVSCRLSRCSLHVVDTTTGRGRILHPPTGYHGYALGGQFSPDGSLLATFVPAKGPYAFNAIRLVVVHVRTGRASITGPTLFAGPELLGEATWSRDGHWLYFGGLAGTLDAQQFTRSGPHGSPWTLPLDTSFAVTGD